MFFRRIKQPVVPLQISTLIFACIFGGAMLGFWLRNVIPAHHLDPETKDVVKLGAGLVGTMAALLLGLLVASAKSSFDTRSTELTQMAADIVRVDRSLSLYGPDAAKVRGDLKTGLTVVIDQLWPKDRKQVVLYGAGLQGVFERVQQLAPRTEAQRQLQTPSRVILGQLRPDAITIVRTERDNHLKAVPRGCSVLAQHAFRQLWVICAAKRDGIHRVIDRGPLGRWCLILNLGA